MGGSTQSGSSSGNSNFNSNPINVSNPAFYGLGNTVAGNFNNALNYFTGNGTFVGGGGQTGYGSPLSPYQGYNWNPTTNQGGPFDYANTAQNPLVAPVGGQQQGFLNQLPYYSASPNAGAASGAAGAAAYGAQNPSYLNTASGATGNALNLAPYFTGPGGPLSTANSGAGYVGNSDFGAGAANAGFNAALGQGYGAGTAGQGAGFATNPLNFGGGTAGNAAQFAGNPNNFGTWGAYGASNYANNIADYGTAPALGALNYARTAAFGTPQAYQAAQFAGQNQNLGGVSQALRNEMAPDFARNLAVNPFTQSVVGAAEAPILNTFNTQTIPGLQGTFTAAGQRIGAAGTGVGGSSAYDIAGANALTGLGANLGATAASIYNPTYQTGLGIQAAAPGQLAAVQAQKLAGKESAAQTALQTETGRAQALQAGAAGLGNAEALRSAALVQAAQAQTGAGSAQANALAQAAGAQTAAGTGQAGAISQAAGAQTAADAARSGALAQAAGAETAAQGTRAGAFNAAAGAQGNALNSAQGAYLNPAGAAAQQQQISNTGLTGAASANQSVATSQLTDTINALNASALPQLTQQYGINNGLALYNNQISSFLTLLGLGTQAAQPTIGNVSSGSGTNAGASSGKGLSI